MTRKIFFLIFLIIITIVIYYIDFKIKNYDMSFYMGKDDGAFARIKSISILSCLFYLGMSKKYRFIQFILGFFIGLFSSVFGYLLAGYYLDRILNDFGLTFHILSCMIFITFFFLIEKLIDKIAPDGSDLRNHHRNG